MQDSIRGSSACLFQWSTSPPRQSSLVPTIHCSDMRNRHRYNVLYDCVNDGPNFRRPVSGRRNYAGVAPKCGIYYRDGGYVKVGTTTHTGTCRALSGTSATEAEQKVYEPEGGEIVLERKRAKGASGIHVSLSRS